MQRQLSSRVHRHIRTRFRGLRRGAFFSAVGRTGGRCIRGRPVGAGHGIRGRPHFRRTFQSGGDLRAGCGGPFRSGARGRAISSSKYSAEPRPQRCSISCSRARRPGKWNNFIAISNLYGGAKAFSWLGVPDRSGLTALFLIVIVSVTSKHAPAGFAPIAIGLALTLIHLVAIPVSNASVNPARSTATAIFGGGGRSDTLWLFWVAPMSEA